MGEKNQGGVIPIDSIVTAATMGQSFDRLSFGGLTTDHANFWPLTFDRSVFLHAKESRYLNCNPSIYASLYVRK